MMRVRVWPTLVGGSLLVGVWWSLAATASAHIDPDPLAAQAGTTATIAFGVEHGCGASPTNGLTINLPAGVSGVKAEPKPGWSATVSAAAVTFTGGPSPKADAADTFAVTMTLPAAPTELHFPIIQRCVEGETDWLQVPAAGQEEPERPAATLKVTAVVPTQADLTPPAEDGAGGDDDHGEDAAGSAASDSGDDGVGAPLVVGLVAAAVVIVGGVVGAFVLRRRDQQT